MSAKRDMAQSLPKALVVDDDKLIIAILTDMLDGRFTITTASDGEAAVDALRHDEFDVVLCDHMMPKMTGVEALEHCMKMQPGAARILVTASEKSDDVRDAVNIARVHRVVIKPIREVEVDAAVSAAIRECELENENKRLVFELKKALADLQNREVELEHELTIRTRELKDLTEQLVKARG